MRRYRAGGIGYWIGAFLSFWAWVIGSRRRAVLYVRQGVEPVEAARRAVINGFWLHLIGAIVLCGGLVDTALVVPLVLKPWKVLGTGAFLLVSLCASLWLGYQVWVGCKIRSDVVEERWTPGQRRRARAGRLILLAVLWWPATLLGPVLWTVGTVHDQQRDCQHYMAVTDIHGYAECVRSTDT